MEGKTGVDATNAGLDGSRDGVTEAAAVNEAVDVDNDRGVKPCGVPSLRPRGVKKDPTHILGDMAKMISYSHSWMPIHGSRF
jgi:hypothetical protein